MVELIGQAVVMFAVTNIDDIILLSLFFGRARGDRAAERQVVVGQYLGFGGILVVSVLAAVGLSFLPESVLAYLGLDPARHRGEGGGRGVAGAPTPLTTTMTLAEPPAPATLGQRRSASDGSPASPSPTGATTWACTCPCSPAWASASP